LHPFGAGVVQAQSVRGRDRKTMPASSPADGRQRRNEENFMKRLITAAAIAVFGLAATTVSAEACNPLLDKNFGKHVAPAQVPISMLAHGKPDAGAANTIVGLWHVVHTANDGTLFLESYDQWDADGGEFELGKLPPASGSLCIGNWVAQNNAVKLLTHVTWLYDMNGNWTGTLNMTQTNAVDASGNSYKGHFLAKFFDTNGNKFMQIAGTTAAQRLVQQ
jgi:hypothetical protein